MMMRAIRPRGAVRLGVFGSLSATSSTTASNVKIATAGIEPMRASVPWTFIQPRWTAHAVVAGAVSERNAAKNPNKKVNIIVIVPLLLIPVEFTVHPHRYTSAVLNKFSTLSVLFASQNLQEFNN